MFSAAQRPDCWATEPSCGQRRRRFVIGGDVGDVADGVHAGVAVDGEVRADVDPAAAAGSGPAPCAIAEPPTRRRPRRRSGPRIVRPVVELDPIGVHGGDAGAEPERRRPASVSFLRA